MTSNVHKNSRPPSMGDIGDSGAVPRGAGGEVGGEMMMFLLGLWLGMAAGVFVMALCAAVLGWTAEARG